MALKSIRALSDILVSGAHLSWRQSVDLCSEGTHKSLRPIAYLIGTYRYLVPPTQGLARINALPVTPAGETTREPVCRCGSVNLAAVQLRTAKPRPADRDDDDTRFHGRKEAGFRPNTKQASHTSNVKMAKKGTLNLSSPPSQIPVPS
jgi:hypothetical protein